VEIRFVWEEAIALGNSLNQLGIKRVTGNLVITSNFELQIQSQCGGSVAEAGLDAQMWPVLLLPST